MPGRKNPDSATARICHFHPIPHSVASNLVQSDFFHVQLVRICKEKRVNKNICQFMSKLADIKLFF
jgi:hypothetical protein